MITAALGVVKDELNIIGIPYEFMRWNTAVNGRYWVGECTESPTNTEDGYEEATFLLTGTTKGAWYDLLDDRTKIKDHFPNIGGLRTVTDNGVVVIFYENAFPVPTGEADLKRIQVNLRIKMWKGK